MINSFKGSYSWLSNFFYAIVVLDDVLYPSVEHAYQAAKSLDREYRQRVLFCRSAAAAKKLGREAALRHDWHLVRYPIMLDLVRQKFKNSVLCEWLKRTGNIELVEGNYWHDTYWGVCYCRECGSMGENKLGEILMLVRSELS